MNFEPLDKDDLIHRLQRIWDVECPFCGDPDLEFDALGLRNHLFSGQCEALPLIPSGREEERNWDMQVRGLREDLLGIP